MEYHGDTADADQFASRGDPTEAAFIAFWPRQGRPVAAMNVGIRGAADTITALIASGRRFDPTALADRDVDLAAAQAG